MKKKLARLGFCTGAAVEGHQQAIDLRLDGYLTGEVSERIPHQARESGVHYFALGHHASERYGVQALGDHLSAHFSIAHQFIEIHNPV